MSEKEQMNKPYVIRYISADGLERVEKTSVSRFSPRILRALNYPPSGYVAHEGVLLSGSLTFIDNIREYEFFREHETNERVELIYKEKRG